jgi:twitching motility protein PilU
MQTFDSHLLKLYKQGIISYEEALKNADSPNNLQLKIKLSRDHGQPSVETEHAEEQQASNSDGLSLEAMEEETEEDAETEDDGVVTFALPQASQ